MRETIKRKTRIEPRTITTEELMGALSCGRTAALQIGEAAGAKIKVGRRVLWIVGRIDEYLASQK